MTMTKYITFINQEEMESFRLFPDYEQHSNIAKEIGLDRRILGAGFLHIFDGNLICNGNSSSLGIKSREEKDADIIAQSLETFH